MCARCNLSRTGQLRRRTLLQTQGLCPNWTNPARCSLQSRPESRNVLRDRMRVENPACEIQKPTPKAPATIGCPGTSAAAWNSLEWMQNWGLFAGRTSDSRMRNCKIQRLPRNPAAEATASRRGSPQISMKPWNRPRV